MSRRAKKGEQPDGPFVMHSMEMRGSIAWRFLPPNARLALESLEVEHMGQGGAANGQLKHTHADFERGGVPRKGVALAIRQLEFLGLIEVTFRARPSLAEFRRSNEFRLTYLSGRGSKAPAATHDWRRIKTEEDAAIALAEAAKVRSAEHVRKAIKAMPDKLRAVVGRR